MKYINTIDSHVHLNLIERFHPRRIQWLKQNSCAVISWSYFHKIESISDLKRSLESKATCLKKHFSEGLACRYLIGVHPRCIPPSLKPEEIEPLLKPYLEEDPLCIGIGEIGLETDDTKQREIFSAQLELGASMRGSGTVIGIHTPKADKRAMTAVTLNMLQQFHDSTAMIVVDHCTLETVESVIDGGFWAGVTISSDKTSWSELKQIVSNNSDQINRIMCNTDSGGRFFEDLVRHRYSEDLPEDILSRLFWGGAAQFFGIEQRI